MNHKPAVKASVPSTNPPLLSLKGGNRRAESLLKQSHDIETQLLRRIEGCIRSIKDPVTLMLKLNRDYLPEIVAALSQAKYAGGEVMAKQDVVLKDVDIPDGYEATGELRWPTKGELTLRKDKSGLTYFKVCDNDGEDFGPRIILRRIEPPAILALRKVMALIRANEWKYSPNECYQLCEKAIADWDGSK